jgi:hypothetical protein
VAGVSPGIGPLLDLGVPRAWLHALGQILRRRRARRLGARFRGGARRGTLAAPGDRDQRRGAEGVDDSTVVRHETITLRLTLGMFIGKSCGVAVRRRCRRTFLERTNVRAAAIEGPVGPIGESLASSRSDRNWTVEDVGSCGPLGEGVGSRVRDAVGSARAVHASCHRNFRCWLKMTIEYCDQARSSSPFFTRIIAFSGENVLPRGRTVTKKSVYQIGMRPYFLPKSCGSDISVFLQRMS